jgi:hypothetical protein
MQDTSWLDVYLSDIPHVVYQVGDPSASSGAQHATLANKGNEAMAYLQFILDYWERLPASIVFLHGQRCAHMAAHAPINPQLQPGGARSVVVKGTSTVRFTDNPKPLVHRTCRG